MNIILCSLQDKRGDCFVFEKGDERYLHIIKVLKLKVGDFFRAGIINAHIGKARIKQMTEEKIVFEFAPTVMPQPLYPLHLLLGIPRPIQLKRLLKDVSTMGASSIHLVGTVLGEKSYITSSLIACNEIEKHLIEGAAQAGSTLIPSHHIYSTLQKAFQQTKMLCDDELQDNNVIRLLFDVEDEGEKRTKVYEPLLDTEEEKASYVATKQELHDGLQEELFSTKKEIPHLNSAFAKNKQIVLAIGSERGWVRSERELFKKHNFHTITLGHRIMRCETATIAALSYVLTKIGWNV